MELVIKLKELGFLGSDLLHTTNGREYVTRDQLVAELGQVLREHGGRLAASVFDRVSGDVLRFGSAIHRLFESVAWSDSADVDAIVRAWRAGAEESYEVLRDAEQQFRCSMQSGEVVEALRKPTGDVVLWREKAFELILDGALVAGQFDRVVLLRDAAGSYVSAEITDFKSNRVEADEDVGPVAERYVEQMMMYRQALAKITGLPLSAVRAALLFTRAARKYDFSPALA